MCCILSYISSPFLLSFFRKRKKSLTGLRFLCAFSKPVTLLNLESTVGSGKDRDRQLLVYRAVAGVRKRHRAEREEGWRRRRCGCLITSLSRAPKYASSASIGRGAPPQPIMDLRGKNCHPVLTFSPSSSRGESRGTKSRILRQRKRRRSLP